MNRRTFLTAVGSAVLITNAGCTENKSQKEIMSEITDVKSLHKNTKGLMPDVDVLRFIDREAGIVLYVENEGAGVGITSVPLSETNFA